MTFSAVAKVLGFGYEAGVAVKAPEFKGSFDTTVNTAGGVCNNPNFRFGLHTTMQVGGEIYAYTGPDFLNPTTRRNILRRFITFADTCVGRP